jgi:hypothetical protein
LLILEFGLELEDGGVERVLAVWSFVVPFPQRYILGRFRSNLA